MKIRINKKLEGGKYYVELQVLEITPEEGEKIKKFGGIPVSVTPLRVFYKRGFVSALPLHELNFTFTFDTQVAANIFAINMKRRVEEAVKKLQSLTDRFSKSEDYEF